MRVRCVHVILIGLLLGVAALGQTPVEAQSPFSRYFQETDKWVEGLLLDFWQNNGTETLLGYPISCEGSQWIQDPVNPDWYTVQWFQRFRLEKHLGDPVLNDVELGRMGMEVLASESPPRADLSNGTVSFVRALPPAPAGCDYSQPFGQNLCGDFRSTWIGSGGLAKNGLPLSSRHTEFIEDPDPANEGNYPIQWFERARFEFHANFPPGAQVARGLLGSALYLTDGDLSKPPKIHVSCDVALSNRSLVDLRDQGVKAEQLALEDTALYGHDGSVALLFAPATDLPIVPADALAEQLRQRDLGALNRRPLGALTIVRQDDKQLPPGDYVLTIDPSGTVVFAGKERRELPISVYRLPTPLPRPISFATAAQKCIAWGQTSVCAEALVPQSDSSIELLKQAAKVLGLVPSEPNQPGQVDLNQAVSLTAGEAELNSCVNALKGDQARYDQCMALVLAAPATEDGAFPAPDERGPITAIGMVLVLKDISEKGIREEVFADPELTKPLDTLPSGPYRVYEVTIPTSRKPASGVAVTSVRLSGPAGDFYLPALSGVALRGQQVYGDKPGGPQDAAVTTSLILRDRCFLRAGRCPAHPR